MRASILDLRRRMPEVLRALESNEPVTILHRGKEKAWLYPASLRRPSSISATNHPAFGLWKDRKDLRQVERFVRKLRKGRFHAL